MKKFGVMYLLLFLVCLFHHFLHFLPQRKKWKEVLMATNSWAKKPLEPLYFINIGGKKTKFSLPATAPPNLKPGQK